MKIKLLVLSIASMIILNSCKKEDKLGCDKNKDNRFMNLVGISFDRYGDIDNSIIFSCDKDNPNDKTKWTYVAYGDLQNEFGCSGTFTVDDVCNVSKIVFETPLCGAYYPHRTVHLLNDKSLVIDMYNFTHTPTRLTLNR